MLFKIFPKLIKKAQIEMVDSQIPEEQFWFRHGQSTLDAVTK
jgi:hypothetical protein